MGKKSQIRKNAELVLSELDYNKVRSVFKDNALDGQRIKFSHVRLDQDDLNYARKRFAELNSMNDTRVYMTGKPGQLGYAGVAFKIYNN